MNTKEKALQYLSVRVGEKMAKELFHLTEKALKIRVAEKGFVARISQQQLLSDMVESQCMMYMVAQGKMMRKKAFLEISDKYRRRLQRQLSKNWGKEEAEDLASQAIVILIENILDGRFQGKSSILTYLEAILRNLQRKIWASRQMAEKHLEAWYQRENEPDPEVLFIAQEKQQKIIALLAKLGEKCQEILQLWMLRYRMKEIAARMSYASESVARNTKKRCMQSLVQLIEKNPDIKQMLNELL